MRRPRGTRRRSLRIAVPWSQWRTWRRCGPRWRPRPRHGGGWPRRTAGGWRRAQHPCRRRGRRPRRARPAVVAWAATSPGAPRPGDSDLPFRVRTAVDIRFRDVDALGHVNNAVYFTYFEIARSAYFAAVQGRRLGVEDFGIVVAEAG